MEAEAYRRSMEKVVGRSGSCGSGRRVLVKVPSMVVAMVHKGDVVFPAPKIQSSGWVPIRKASHWSRGYALVHKIFSLLGSFWGVL